MQSRNALAEARAVAGPDAWVLEPSRPAVLEGPFFADDPVAAGDLDWTAWVGEDGAKAAWAADRWLAAWRPLGAAPPGLLALHRIAFYVVAPARKRVNTKFGLRWTLGGFGTPFFGEDEQVLVRGSELIVQRGDRVEARPITTLADAAGFVLKGPPDLAWGSEFDVPDAGEVGASLNVDPDAASFLGDWYGFAWSVLEELRADAESVDASRVQLWPEHFDAAVECLRGERRAVFGASPGDASSPEPYMYVSSPRVTAVPGELWNATTFDGAALPLGSFVDSADQRAEVLEFFRTRRAALASS
ncbi:MAG: hypothetical protein JO148_12210 [Acidimicrobiia bacterium]|nr:hypothetical protein [Acidimicrobiia bacterium]